MKRFFWSSAALILAVSSLHADTLEERSDIREDDVRAIRDWLNAKRQVTVKEKGGALSISGEVRTEFQTTNERINGVRQRGSGGATGEPKNAFDVEADLMMDYRTDTTWAAIKLKFDNDAGIFSGSKNKISLDRAYLGVRLLDRETFTVDGEVGRRKMGNIFDSKIEFDSLFDGLLMSYDASFEKVGNFYAHIGSFIIDDRRNHFGYVGELGLLNIANTGFYSKYSLIDWDTKHYPKNHTIGAKTFTNLNQRFHFLISQLIFGYRFIPVKLDRLVVIYLAGLYNHKAQKSKITRHRKLNWGSYFGFSIGELKKQGDWAFDANYQAVAPQAIPDFDVSGIGLGNTNRSGFFTEFEDGTGAPQTRETASGKVNYRGYQFTLEYLLTNNITLFQSWQDAMTLYSDIGPFRHYKQYEIEFIYGF
jgi:hypothetical protein